VPTHDVDESDGDITPDVDEGPQPPLRRVIAWTLLISGRVLLPSLPVAIALCRLTESAWRSAPLDGGISSHWIPTLTMIILLVTGAALPALLLPIGSAALAERTSSRLRLPTVLGWRSVDLTDVKLRWIHVPGRGYGLDLVVVRGPRCRWIIIAASQLWQNRIGYPASAATTDQNRRGSVGATTWGVAILLAVVLSAYVTTTIGMVLAGLAD
jgi:hypothetical protein